MMLTIEQARRAYAEEIRAISEIRCDALIEGLGRVPREVFLGPGPWRIVRPMRMSWISGEATSSDDEYRMTPDDDPRHLYHNVLVAIDPARSLNNGQPSANLAWIDSL